MSADPRLIQYAREMRREPTPCEEILWRELRNRRLGGFKFRRQHPVGRYIADFYSSEASLVVELDGDSHTEPGSKEYDVVRYEYLRELRLEVVRFWNLEVHDNLEGILSSILEHCLARAGSKRSATPNEDRRPSPLD